MTESRKEPSETALRAVEMALIYWNVPRAAIRNALVPLYAIDFAPHAEGRYTPKDMREAAAFGANWFSKTVDCWLRPVWRVDLENESLRRWPDPVVEPPPKTVMGPSGNDYRLNKPCCRVEFRFSSHDPWLECKSLPLQDIGVVNDLLAEWKQERDA